MTGYKPDNCRVLLLDTKRCNPNHYIFLAIRKGLQTLSMVESVTIADYGNAVTRAQEFSCNLFLAFDGESMQRGICRQLSAICGRSALWVTEDPYEHKINLQNAALFDVVFTNDRTSTAAYGPKGHHLPLAAAPEFHFYDVGNEEAGSFRYDVFFAGTAWPNRVEFLKRLLPRIPGLKLKWALPFNEHLPDPDIGLPRSNILWRTPSPEFCRFANRSRIVLVLHRDFSVSGERTLTPTPGPRLFEGALAGGFQLVDRDTSDCHEFYRPEEEMATFSSVDECASKIDYYLSHSDERCQMAKAAQERTQQSHLYHHRLEAMMEEIQKLPVKEFRPMPTVPSRSCRPRVLYVTHNTVGVPPFGGVEVYQQSMIKELQKQFEFFVYAPTGAHPLGSQYAVFDEHQRQLEKFSFQDGCTDLKLADSDRERIFSGLLGRYGIHLVHFQHLLYHVPSLPFLCRALGVPTVMTLNDFFVVCRNFNLIGYQGRYCNISELPAETCDVCLQAQCQAAAGSQAKRHTFYRRMLEQLDVALTNTQGIAEIFKKQYPVLEEHNRLRVFGLPVAYSQECDLSVRGRDPLKVAIVGNFTSIKGADLFVRIFDQMREDRIEFHVFGAVDFPFDGILEKLKLPNVILHHSYEVGSLAETLKEFSLSLHLSIWPETYCLTLSEAWQAGVVPVVSDLGALGERVEEGGNGFKVPVGEAGSVISILRDLVANPERIESVRQQLRADQLVVSARTHAGVLSDIYGELCEREQTSSVRRIRDEDCEITLSDCGVFLNDDEWSSDQEQPAVTEVVEFKVPQPSAGILAQKVRSHMRRHGLRATGRRVVEEGWHRLSRTLRRERP